MKKTLIASAIAAATFSGAVAAQESNLPTVYGNIQYAITHTNVDGGGSAVDHFDNGTTLGVTHDHEIAPGITGFLKMELEGINADDKAASSGIDKLDEAYIGVKGDSFGQVWVGSDDSMYESAIDKIVNFHEVGTGVGGSYDTGEGDLIQYLTPSFGGLKLGAAVQVNGDGDADNNGKSYPYQLAAMYSVDALELAVAMDSNDGNTAYSKNTASVNNENTYGVRATYAMGDFSLTGEYQTRKDVSDEYGVIGVYTMGANQFSLAYQLVEDDNTSDQKDVVALQALHNVSDNMYVYFEGYLYGSDNNEFDLEDGAGAGDEQSIAAIGGVYYF
ncbi:porin [Marinobacter pelagius]|uniref:Outer membrane protein (Porin) n=1 Tax=Marinobacter pelagius TaxID=379482 RepID=A0A1I4YW34_9GAMM|nr:porin [Marinobacter pelagius]SFN42266.1 Outer membrane protein (porin) [Marinobacter pelagius]